MSSLARQLQDLKEQLCCIKDQLDLIVADGGDMSDTLEDGHLIGIFTNGAGSPTSIFETVSSMVDNQNGTYTFTNEEGTETIIYTNYPMPYLIEWISDDPAVEQTFEPAVEIDADHDFAIIPKLIPDPTTGKIYNVFRAGSMHNPAAGMQVIIRVSSDGGMTWLSPDGLADFEEVPSPFGSNIIDCSGGAVTPTGRLVLFLREFNAATYQENYHIWSDDGGLTWSSPVVTGAGNQLGYMYDTRFCQGQYGELIYGQRTIDDDTPGVRKIKYYHSFDDGETWTQRSIALDNSDKGWNFGEVITRDLGNGFFLAVVRLAALNDESMNVPFLITSFDYGLHWAGPTETLTFQDIQDGLFKSGFIPLEGSAVNLGGATANESCLPWMEIVRDGQTDYMLISYYLRNAGDEWRFTMLRVDEWLTMGRFAIRTDIYNEFFVGDPGGFNAPDGNGALYVPKNRKEFLYCIADNTGTSSAGPSILEYGKVNIAAVQAVIDSYDAGTIYS